MRALSIRPRVSQPFGQQVNHLLAMLMLEVDGKLIFCLEINAVLLGNDKLRA